MGSRTTLTIPSRYCGPPFSGNGGYSCGITAAELGQNPAEVSLLAAPPVDRPLVCEVDAEEAKLLDGDTLIAVARRAPEPDPGPAITADEAAAAIARFDVDGYASRHAYPTCFTCGPHRAQGDGLRLFPGATASPGVFVWQWIPHESVSDGTGTVEEPVVWAALDCPSGMSWLTSDRDLGPIVLGRLATGIHRRPSVGELLVVVGWTKEASGRKRIAGSSIRTTDGELLGAGHATWIVLTDEQQVAFSAASPTA